MYKYIHISNGENFKASFEKLSAHKCNELHVKIKN